jgi:hypothetical protein
VRGGYFLWCYQVDGRVEEGKEEEEKYCKWEGGREGKDGQGKVLLVNECGSGGLR